MGAGVTTVWDTPPHIPVHAKTLPETRLQRIKRKVRSYRMHPMDMADVGVVLISLYAWTQVGFGMFLALAGFYFLGRTVTLHDR